MTAGVSSRLVTLGMLQMARAASKMTISCLWRRQDSRKSKKGRCSPASPVPDSEITWATKRTSRHCARGDLQSNKAFDSLFQGWWTRLASAGSKLEGTLADVATLQSRGPCSRPDTTPQWGHQTAHHVTGPQGQQAMPAACYGPWCSTGWG